MSAVSLWASFHLHDCWNDQVRKSGLGSISITSSFRGNLPSPREDRLVLFTMVACVYRNAGRHATHWIHQGNFYGFGAGFLFWFEKTESDRVWWSDDWRQLRQANCEPLYSRLSSSKSQRDLYRAESISSGGGKSQHKPKRSLFAAIQESTRQIAKLDSGQANVSRANIFLFKSVRRGCKKTFWLSADWSKNYYPR